MFLEVLLHQNLTLTAHYEVLLVTDPIIRVYQIG